MFRKQDPVCLCKHTSTLWLSAGRHQQRQRAQVSSGESARGVQRPKSNRRESVWLDWGRRWSNINTFDCIWDVSNGELKEVQRFSALIKYWLSSHNKVKLWTLWKKWNTFFFLLMKSWIYKKKRDHSSIQYPQEFWQKSRILLAHTTRNANWRCDCSKTRPNYRLQRVKMVEQKAIVNKKLIKKQAGGKK